MKTFALLLLTAFMGKGCSSTPATDLKNTVVEYTANTRGYYIKITVKDQKITVSRDRNGNDKPVAEKIEDADWKALVAEFQKIDLDKLSTYEGPTQKRFYDGAAIANLHILFKDKAYDSQTFDNGFPPLQIEKFVKLLTALSIPK
jgi:hypothetical protein